MTKYVLWASSNLFDYFSVEMIHTTFFAQITRIFIKDIQICDSTHRTLFTNFRFTIKLHFFIFLRLEKGIGKSALKYFRLQRLYCD